jgi:hypothetical protein
VVSGIEVEVVGRGVTLEDGNVGDLRENVVHDVVLNDTVEDVAANETKFAINS